MFLTVKLSVITKCVITWNWIFVYKYIKFQRYKYHIQIANWITSQLRLQKVNSGESRLKKYLMLEAVIKEKGCNFLNPQFRHNSKFLERIIATVVLYTVMWFYFQNCSTTIQCSWLYKKLIGSCYLTPYTLHEHTHTHTNILTFLHSCACSSLHTDLYDLCGISV